MTDLLGLNKPTAMVVFCDPPPELQRVWWLRLVLRFLKPGFKHCQVFVPGDGARAIVINGAANQLFVYQSHPGLLMESILAQGLTYLAVPLRVNDKPSLCGLLTCVSVVKQVLGVGGWAITPWQLYKHLHRQNVKQQKGD
jgi:hypothetical protein